MKKGLIIFTLILISQFVFSQVDDCNCFNGIGSTESKKPSLSINFSNGLDFSICGYNQEIVSENEAIISEFDVFNCKTGESIITFGALQTCTVITKTDTLIIEEMIDLPVEKDWKNKKVKITRRKIYPQNDILIMSPPAGIYEKSFIDQEQVDQFFNELEKLKGKGYNNDLEVFIMKLALLSLNENKKARDILFNFKSYIDYPLDGAASETWNEYTSLVNYLNK